MNLKPSAKTFLAESLKLIRIGNLFILGITQYFVAIFLIGPKSNWEIYITDVHLFLIVISTIVVAAAGYIINDYYDVKIDIINKPQRVTIGKILARRTAILAHITFSLSGILLGLIVSWKIAVINLFAVFCLWLYSNSLKRLPLTGNIVVSFLTSMSVIVVGLHYKTNLTLVLIYATFAFFISLVREIVKDMEDVKGDGAFGCKTLPLVYGIRTTKIFIYLFLSLFIITLLILAKEINPKLITYFTIFTLCPLTFLVLRLSKADSSKDFRFLSKLCKYIMLGGIISMICI